MKLYFACLVLVLINVFRGESAVIVNDTATIISVELEPQSMMRLRYFDDFLVQRVLEFRNATNANAVISRKVYVNNIAEFKYDVFDGTTNQSYYNLFYVAKGDKILLALQDFKLKNKTKNNKLFVNDFLNVNESIFNMPGAQGKLDDQIKANKGILNANLKKIDSLSFKKELTDSVAGLWKEIANNFYYLKLAKLNVDRSQPLFDTLAKELTAAVAKKTKINSNFLNLTITKIANYNQTKNGLNYNLKSFITEVGSVNTEKRYKTGLAYQALGVFPEKESKLYLESYALFNNTLSDSAFRSQDYAGKIVPNQKSFDKTTVKLLNTDNVALTLNDVFKKNKGKILVIDLWASWCVPCIQEFPFLEKTKANFKNKNIVFVGVSLDKDAKVKNWKDVFTSAKIDRKNQFRVVEQSNKLISGLYRIETIPRYLVFDKNGSLINEHFLKPSDKNFESELNRYIESL
ncbi:TlpA disulfide reductase family protein [Pedobacter nototheniae]|uniref:TlpA family protein disulfide reductase n=1 Tax=Pedobacter nototheniae TaxID=2488994 RepID=UPI00292E9CF0|nr:TlpA disulfide reductase family protein [Pedobacter nototheniae]